MPSIAVLVMLFGLSAAPQQDALARARRAYNAGLFDDAIAAAGEAGRNPKEAEAAAVVLARAHLERYRLTTHDTSDLNAARAALTGVDASKLDGAEYAEMLVGLGEALYYDDNYAAAAEEFAIALARDEGHDPPARERLFDWWASALDQQAQLGPEDDRKPIYERILARATEELSRHDRSAVASYWTAAAARGADDLDRAWGAAVAAWVRAPATIGQGGTLRADLDRLMTLVILPARAHALAPSGDVETVLQRLSEEWQQIKDRWGGR